MASRFSASASSTSGSSVSGSDGETVQVIELEESFRRAQHQLGLAHVHRRGGIRQQCGIDSARAQLERGASGQQRSTAHCGRAAEDADAAEHTLVAVARPWLERGGHFAFFQQPAAGLEQGGGIQPQRIDMNLATVIRAVGGEQTGLERDEGKGVAGADCGTEGLAGIGIKAAGHVQRQHRQVHAVDFPHQFQMAPAQFARQADAEQAVDHQPPIAVRRDGVEQFASSLPPSLQRVCGIGRQLGGFPGKYDAYLEPPGFEVTCCHQRVAAVVARPDQDQYRGLLS
jgi:hypothetical protein